MASRSIVKRLPARAAAGSVSIGKELVRYVVAKACRVAVEGQLADAYGAVTLLRHDDFCQPVDFFATLFPALVTLVVLLVGFGLPACGFRPLEIVLLTIYEEHHIGVLLDRTGFAQIR